MKTFSHWRLLKEQQLGIYGDGFDTLSDTERQKLDSVIEKYILFRFTPQPKDLTIHQYDLCTCGHIRKEHARVTSLNYTDGICVHKDCKCQWFNFASKGNIPQ